ncbi:MAG: ATP-binding protein [Bacteroidales bacterium]|nr:ATP-binding protein [Bacteroidales bacterium]
MFNRRAKHNILKGFKYGRIVIINGARQCGKTTLVRQIAKENNIPYITLDDPQKLKLAQTDTQNFIEFYKPPIVIDEIQYAPELIPYIKQKVDFENIKGMYLLTGSSDFYKSLKVTESLAGRMLHYELFNLSAAEINNYQENIIEMMFDDNLSKLMLFGKKFENKNINDVFTKITVGGFPELQNLDAGIRKIWFQSYLQSRILKDVETFFDINKENKILDLLTILAANTANLLNINNIAKSIQLDFKTVKKYIELLEAMYLVKQIPVYSKNSIKQVIKQRKLHFTDTGLVSYLLNVSESKLINRETEYLGNLLENYIFTELSKESSYADNPAKIYHYRDLRKKEVDFILERADNKIIPVEVKAKSEIKSKDIAGILSFARNFSGKIFRAFVFYSGKELMPMPNNAGLNIYLIPSKFLV